MSDKEHSSHLEDGHNSPTRSMNEKIDVEAGDGGPHQLQRVNTIPNEVNLGFVMTMLGFSMTFVTAEVIPLFMITLFSVIAIDLNAPDKVIWMLNSQIIAVGAIAPFVGTLSDLLGRKGIVLLSLCLTVIAMILLGTTPNIAGALASQALSGIAIGIQLLTSIAAVTELVPTNRRGITIGYIVMGFLPFAPASLYGQLLAEHSWRWISVFIGSWALGALVILAIFYKPPPRVNSIGLTKRQLLGRIDYLGAILSTSGVTIFLIGINWGGINYDWSDKHVVATLTVGLALLAAWAVWEFFAPYPMFPMALAQHKKMFIAVLILCLCSGINYIPGIVFWVVQTYTCYGASFRDAGIWLLPIGFCIAGGAVISAVLMTIFHQHIHLILLGFCIIQTAGLGSLAAYDVDNINTIWGPLILGLIGVGGVLLPSQVVFSIISPPELIGTSVALSIVVRSMGQVIGTSMFYNIFEQKVTASVYEHIADFVLPAAGVVGLDPVKIKALVVTLTAGPFSVYGPQLDPTITQATIDQIQAGGKAVYEEQFRELYLISIAFGGAAIICCLFLRDIKKYMNDHVAVAL